MYAKRVVAVCLLLLLFVAFTFTGILYADHETRRIGYGETVPFIWVEKQKGEVKIKLHVFGKIYFSDITKALAAWDSFCRFAEKYGFPAEFNGEADFYYLFAKSSFAF